ncbi:MAG: SGNH/GDSL hydrolase family protein [Bacilli bacterium]|nr:SGNH/GDSL hydrolase family protein [Bacilli bacterium]
MKITQVDKNFISKKINNRGRVVPVPSKFVTLFGVKYDKNVGFYRIPLRVVKTISSNIGWLNNMPAGGRIAFKTNSSFLKIHVSYPNIAFMPHMPLTGLCGFTLLEIINHREFHKTTFRPDNPNVHSFVGSVQLSNNHKIHEYILYFPLYNQASSLNLEIAKGSKIIKSNPYKSTKPILYYGSSITQGGCASRPDNSYEALIGKKFNVDHINLGFSGNAFGELEIADYLARIDCSIFVLDYDHNAKTAEDLNNTHERLFKIFRRKHPKTPVIILSAPNYHNNPKYYEERKKIVKNTYQQAIKRGDKNVYFIDGSKIYPPNMRESCSVDGAHPNDLGFYYFYKCINKVIKDNKLLSD